MITPERHGLAWTTIEDDMLRDEFNEQLDLEAIALNHQRKVNAVVTRMLHLGLLTLQGRQYHRVDQDPWSSFEAVKALNAKIYGGS